MALCLWCFPNFFFFELVCEIWRWNLAKGVLGGATELPLSRALSMNGSSQALTNTIGNVFALIISGGQELEGAIFARSGITIVKRRCEFGGSIVASLCQLPLPEMELSLEMDAFARDGGHCRSLQKSRERERKFRGES